MAFFISHVVLLEGDMNLRLLFGPLSLSTEASKHISPLAFNIWYVSSKPINIIYILFPAKSLEKLIK